MRTKRPKRHSRQQTARYELLLEQHFTTREARMLSVLAKNTPALRLLRNDRIARWDRFTKIANRKQARNQWQAQDIQGKWLKNLYRLYHKRRWCVQYGGSGRQPDMKKGDPNPWAMYRSYERRVGGPRSKGYTSPWELRLVRSGKTMLDKGLILIEKGKRTGQPVPHRQVREWIENLNTRIRGASGSRKAQLLTQRDNLRRSL